MATVGSASGRRVVVAVDGSASAPAALQAAARTARRLGLPLHVVTAYHWGGSGGATRANRDELRAQAHATLAATLAEAAGDLAGIEVLRDVRFGHPVPVILRAAAGADLLVVGATGRGAGHRLLGDSVAGLVRRHCACPVEVVAPAAPARDEQPPSPLRAGRRLWPHPLAHGR